MGHNEEAIMCHISFKMKVDEDLREPNFTQRQMLLSAALPVLEDALTPSKEVFVFPRDLVLSNTIVMDVLSTLAYGVAQEVGIDTLQTVRTTIFVFFSAFCLKLPKSCLLLSTMLRIPPPPSRSLSLSHV